MKRLLLTTVMILLLLAAAAGCSDETTEGDGEANGVDSSYDPQIDPADFVATVDNRYLPLKPGMSWVYEGETDEGLERVEVTVTNDTMEVMGVTCVVVWDRVWIDAELVEDTFDWFAQDKEGNVWYFGEDSREMEDGQVVSTEGSWEAGVDGARPGIIMHARPEPGGEPYRQEYYAGEAEDMAKVLSLNETVTIGVGTYSDCLRTEEWTPLEPGVTEQKSYAPGIGVILEEVVEGGMGRIELIEFRKN